MPQNPIVATVKALIEPTVEAQGVELYDLEYITEYGRKVLRLYIDKIGLNNSNSPNNGIGLDDCERVSHAVEAVLDTNDPISEAYVLEVSSPGIERKLIKDSHYSRHIGELVEVKLYKPFDNRKKFQGILTGLKDGCVEISQDSTELSFNRELIAYCRLIYRSGSE